MQPVHKHISLPADFRASVLATIHERYPIQDWIHVYTDGTATASPGRAGAGIYSKFFNLKEPVSVWSDNFMAKFLQSFWPIGPSLRRLTKTVFFVDSQAAI